MRSSCLVPNIPSGQRSLESSVSTAVDGRAPPRITTATKIRIYLFIFIYIDSFTCRYTTGDRPAAKADQSRRQSRVQQLNSISDPTISDVITSDKSLTLPTEGAEERGLFGQLAAEGSHGQRRHNREIPNTLKAIEFG